MESFKEQFEYFLKLSKNLQGYICGFFQTYLTKICVNTPFVSMFSFDADRKTA